MRVVIDANIIFSALLNSDSTIAAILISPEENHEFIAPEFLINEIRSKYDKLQKISGLSIPQIQEAEYRVLKYVKFISEDQIGPKTWEKALDLTSDIDPNDTPYIALALHFECQIWSGDKKLIMGLSKKGFSDFMSTQSFTK